MIAGDNDGQLAHQSPILDNRTSCHPTRSLCSRHSYRRDRRHSRYDADCRSFESHSVKTPQTTVQKKTHDPTEVESRASAPEGVLDGRARYLPPRRISGWPPRRSHLKPPRMHQERRCGQSLSVRPQSPQRRTRDCVGGLVAYRAEVIVVQGVLGLDANLEQAPRRDRYVHWVLTRKFENREILCRRVPEVALQFGPDILMDHH